MTEDVPMIDNDKALDLIEQAERQTPLCSCCTPTVPVGHPGGVWLECSTLQGPRLRGSRWLQPLDLFSPHLRRLVVDFSEGVAA